MFLELSEAFVCPDCRPAQGLVVLVDRIDGRRVIQGRLGCPECDLRVPIEAETVRFDRLDAAAEGARSAPPAAGERAPPAATLPRLPDLLGDAGPEEAASRLAGLLGAESAAGYLLTDPALAELAPRLAELAPEAEVLALTTAERDAAEGVSWARGAAPHALPLFTGRLAGAALFGDGRGRAEEAIRVVRAGGRVVLLSPEEEVVEGLGGLPARLLAREEDVAVFEREEGGFEEPFARFRGGPRPRREDG